MSGLLPILLFDDQGQDIAEYAVMVAAILIIVIGTIRLIGSNANTVFSNVASAVQYVRFIAQLRRMQYGTPNTVPRLNAAFF